ncbi:MAG: trypsin-like peptidase domain-containing protein [Acidimicrobiales bacterium]|nr:trypsin-like peptidase domain-containing protein [Acidimicrobiales bacterium]
MSDTQDLNQPWAPHPPVADESSPSFQSSDAPPPADETASYQVPTNVWPPVGPPAPPQSPPQSAPPAPPQSPPQSAPPAPPQSPPQSAPTGPTLGPPQGPPTGPPLGHPLGPPTGPPLGQPFGSPSGPPFDSPNPTSGQPFGSPNPTSGPFAPTPHSDPFATGANGTPSGPTTTGTSRKGARARIGALIVATALVAGTAGGVTGAVLTDQGNNTSSSAGSTASRTTPTVAGPVDADSLEPVAEVAAALSPAVVQIETQSGLGSGFVYDESGLIMTADHVINGASQVQVRMADGSRLVGEVLGGDASTDVAVVKIDPPASMAVAALGTGADVVVGQSAIAIGSPFGLDQTVTAGIVSAVGRTAETPGGFIPAIQTDAPINSGNSGGALADRQGRIIGINDSIITGGSGSTGNVGVGFAIPIDLAKPVADAIVAGESTAGGFLGVEGADATGNRVGAAITSVQAGSPAAQAGLSADDVVVGVNGNQVSSMIDLAAAIRTSRPGDEVRVSVLRDGEELDLKIVLGTSPSD